MIEKLQLLHPEIVLFAASCVMLVLGLSRTSWARKLCAPVTALALILAGLVAIPSVAQWLGLIDHVQFQTTPLLLPYAKVMVAGVGLILLPLMPGVVDRAIEAAVKRGGAFDAGRSTRGEFYAFLLFSLTGVMLCATADDLIWLFLALELTSLPTYIMVAISTDRLRSMEAGVKYFFLGAFGAATFLMGFALLYGAAGSTNLHEIAVAFQNSAQEGGGIGPIGTAGLVMAVIGVSFKIAAFPMHFYAADVYQGAAAPVSAYLAFAPKAAGFFALAALLSTAGWLGESSLAGELPDALHLTLWVMAALTMTIGNVLALQQTNAKRILAYSSIAHSGYMLVGLVAGPGKEVAEDGLGAVLFYLLVYGVTNAGAFAVIASLEKPGPDGRPVEAEEVDDLRGLCRTRPLLGWTLVISALALLGMPPLFGFWGKIPLFSSALSAGETALVIVLALNSAAAAFYYLRLAAAPLLSEPDPERPRPTLGDAPSRRLSALLSATGAVVLVIFTSPLLGFSHKASVDAYQRIRSGERMRPVIFRPASADEAPAPRVADPDATPGDSTDS